MMTSPPPPPPQKKNGLYFQPDKQRKKECLHFWREKHKKGTFVWWRGPMARFGGGKYPHAASPQHRHCLFVVMNIYLFSTTAVNFVCDHPLIRAVSFVGSDQAGNYIHDRASRNGKRVQCNMGAKNHGVIMPDANKENTLNQVGN